MPALLHFALPGIEECLLFRLNVPKRAEQLLCTKRVVPLWPGAAGKGKGLLQPLCTATNRTRPGFHYARQVCLLVLINVPVPPTGKLLRCAVFLFWERSKVVERSVQAGTQLHFGTPAHGALGECMIDRAP